MNYTIKELKQNINKALKDEPISNIRVQKRFFKTKHGEIHYIGYAIFGSWGQFIEKYDRTIDYENESIGYFSPTVSLFGNNKASTKDQILDKLKSVGLNVKCIMRGKSLEIVVADKEFDWSNVSVLNNSYKYKFYKVTKTF